MPVNIDLKGRCYLAIEMQRFPHTSTNAAISDTDLIAGFQSGKEDAFTRIYGRLYERLYWYGRKFIPEEQEVEDMIADAFIQAWRKREEFATVESVSMFLHVAVRNQCLNLIKRRQMKSVRHAEIMAALEAQEPGDFYLEQLQAELMRRIFEQVDKLPVQLKEVFMLSYQDGLKPAQIAERLNLNVQTIKNRKVSALKVLRAAVNHEPLLLAIVLLLECEGHIVA